MNKIVIELCEEDRQRLDMLFYRLGVLIERLPEPAPVIEPPQPLQINSLDPEHPADASVSHLDPPAPAPDPVDEAPAPAPISLGEFQKAIVTRCAESAATKQKVQALVHKYAESVSAIPEEKRAEVLTALAEI